MARIPYGHSINSKGRITDIMDAAGHNMHTPVSTSIRRGHIHTVSAIEHWQDAGPNKRVFFGIKLEPERTSVLALKTLRLMVRTTPANHFEWHRISMGALGVEVGDTRKDALSLISKLILGEVDINEKFHPDPIHLRRC